MTAGEFESTFEKIAARAMAKRGLTGEPGLGHGPSRATEFGRLALDRAAMMRPGRDYTVEALGQLWGIEAASVSAYAGAHPELFHARRFPGARGRGRGARLWIRRADAPGAV